MNKLEDKVVLVRYNDNYPENSPHKYIFTIGKIEKHQENENLEVVVDGESFLCDTLSVAGGACTTWSGIAPNGLYKHHFLFLNECWDVLSNGEQLIGVVSPFIENTENNEEVSNEKEASIEEEKEEPIVEEEGNKEEE